MKINKFKKTKQLKIELPYDPGTSLLGKKKKVVLGQQNYSYGGKNPWPLAHTILKN